MDEEKLHSELSKHIRQVFDNYEDTGADEGWLLLREKFPLKKKKRRLVWVAYAAAALVLLCLGIWLFPNKAKRVNQVIAINKPVLQPIGSLKPNNISPNRDSNQHSTGVFTQNEAPKKSVGNSKFTSHSMPDSHIAKADSYHDSASIFTQNNVKPKLNDNLKSTDYSTQHNNTAKTDSSQHYINVFTQNNVTKNHADSGNYTSLPYKQNQPPPLKAPANIFNQKALSRNNADQSEQANRNVTFSVYAATYVNYAKGSDNLINIGAGLTSDVRITGNLKLSTGLAIAQNRLNYNDNNLPNPTQHEAAFAGLAAAAALSSGKPLTGDGTMQSMVRYATTLNGTKNYNASLVGFDIPVNLKYEFNPKKTDSYIAAGVSSGTFITETYRSVYTYSTVSKESDTHNSFSGFDLAKTLNVSFGVGYPLGKNRLIIEPFFKYPLDGLGAQQIKFGASGVNLRLHFH